MSNQDFNAGALAAILWIGTIILSILAGIMAWNWIEPESFIGGVGFIILWGILGKVSHFIMMGIVVLLFGKN
jgi:hypothetical protein